MGTENPEHTTPRESMTKLKGKRGICKLQTVHGTLKETHATLFLEGTLAIHKNGTTYRVTHVASGLLIREYDTLKQARNLVAAIPCSAEALGQNPMSNDTLEELKKALLTNPTY
jgi:hypothetical protein